MNPLTDRYFGKAGAADLTAIYDEVFRYEEEEVEMLKKDVAERYRMSQNTFEDVDGKDREFLQYFSFICMLSFDVYMKKQLIEKMIDELAMKTAAAKEEEKKPDPKKEKGKSKESK